mmetsp:Transcript_24838/g.57244  ORF Transcript_24838/g.57244 Transcript_24838/m.57244 type:complete len:522 (-) Transcript_24838:124-1689(-)
MASILSLWRSKSHARQPTFYFLSFLGAPFFTTGGLFGQGGSGNFSAIVSAGAIFLDFSLDFGHQDNIRDDDGRVETAFGIPFHRCGRQVVSEHIVSYLQQVSQVRYTAKTLIIDSKVRLPRHFYIGQGIFFHPAVGSLVHCILPAPSSLLAELQVEHHEPHHPSGLQQHTDVFLTFPVAIGRELVEERGKRGTSGRRRVYQPRRARDALHQRQPTRQPAGASPRPLEHNQVVAYQRHHVRHHRHLHVGRIILGVGGDQPPARANPERHESRQCRRGRLRLRLSGEVEIEAGPGHVYREHFFAEFGTTRQHGLNGAHARTVSVDPSLAKLHHGPPGILPKLLVAVRTLPRPDHELHDDPLGHRHFAVDHVRRHAHLQLDALAVRLRPHESGVSQAHVQGGSRGAAVQGGDLLQTQGEELGALEVAALVAHGAVGAAHALVTEAAFALGYVETLGTVPQDGGEIELGGEAGTALVGGVGDDGKSAEAAGDQRELFLRARRRKGGGVAGDGAEAEDDGCIIVLR